MRQTIISQQCQKSKISDIDLKNKAQSLILGFNYTSEIQELYRIFAEYINEDASFEKRALITQKGSFPYSLGKGLFIISNPGAGKTFIFEELLSCYFTYRKMTAYQIEDLYSEYGSGALRIHNESIYTRINESKSVYDLYIDDFGREAKVLKHYGTEIKFMDRFIDERYRLLKRNGAITHGSSNFELKDLKTQYSPQTFSRMFELFNFIVLTDTKDFRMQTL